MTKPAITSRQTKGLALTYAELDTNFANLRDSTIGITAGSGGTQVTSDLNGNITLVAGTNVTLSGDNTAKTITINSGGSNITAGTGGTTVTGDLTLVAGNNISLSGNNTTKTISITANAALPTGLTYTDSGSSAGLTIGSSGDTTNTLNTVAGQLVIKNQLVLGNGNYGLWDVGTGGTLNLGTVSSGFDAVVKALVPVAMPIMTTTERNTWKTNYPSLATAGTLVYNSTLGVLQFWNGTSWVDAGTSTYTYTLPIATDTTLGGVKTAIGNPIQVDVSSGVLTLDGTGITQLGTLVNLTIASPAAVSNNAATTRYINVGTHGQLFDDGNFHVHTNSGSLWINSLDGGDIRLGTQTNSGTSSVIVDTTDVGHSFFTKVQSGFNVAFDTEITMDNLKVRIHGTGGTGGVVQAAAVSTNFSAYTTVLGNVAGTAVRGDTNSSGITFTTSFANISGAQLTLGAGGDTTTVHLIDNTTYKIYRITAIHTQGSTSGYTCIERLA